MGSHAHQSVYGGDSLDPRTHQIADGKRLKLNRRVRLQFCPLLPPPLAVYDKEATGLPAGAVQLSCHHRYSDARQSVRESDRKKL